MPWKETCVMDERTMLISDWLSQEFSLSEVARRRGVSRKTAYKWIGRYEQSGPEGLKELSRAAHRHPNGISAQMEQAILDWKERRRLWGAPKIHSKLKGLPDCPAESTVSNVLKRRGWTSRVRRRCRATPSMGPLAVATGPNEVWCADFKGWFRLGDGQRCDPLTISDAYSRFLLCCRGLAGAAGLREVKPWFEATFGEYGMPRVIRTDNGAPFASAGLGGLSALSVWWLRLGIEVERIAPGHPEQNGRHERMHRTLKEATTKPVAPDLPGQQAVFEGFRQEYNEDRPHEALGQQPPASAYAPSPREYSSRLLSPEYGADWVVRAVRSNGEIRWKAHKLYVSESLIGQRVGLEPVADGVWVLHFMSVELGVVDERHHRVQRIKWSRQPDRLPTAPPNGAPGATPRTTPEVRCAAVRGGATPVCDRLVAGSTPNQNV
jgi:transposase InsO family protein